MFEIATDTRTRNAYRRAHDARGAALGNFFRSVFTRRD